MPLSLLPQEPNPWQSLTQRTTYDNAWIRVTEHKVINPTGGKGIYGVVEFKNLAIGIVALDEELNLWLVGQYRFPLQAYSWEIPEGGGSPQEDPLLAAQRELQEETGLQAASWQPLLTLHLSNSVSNEVAYLFLARELTPGSAQPEETEQLQVLKLPLQEAYQRVIAGEITDAMSVAGILQAYLLLAQGQLQ